MLFCSNRCPSRGLSVQQAAFPSLSYVSIPYKSCTPGYKDISELLKHCRQLKAVTTKYDWHSAKRTALKPAIGGPSRTHPRYLLCSLFWNPCLTPHLPTPPTPPPLMQCNKHILFQTSTVYSSFCFREIVPSTYRSSSIIFLSPFQGVLIQLLKSGHQLDSGHWQFRCLLWSLLINVMWQVCLLSFPRHPVVHN